MDVADEELHALYQWVDEIPLSRPKRNIARDFSDGVLVAELVFHYLPRFIDLHNYSGASSVTQKLYNWQTLNDKVFRRLGFSLGQRERENTANCKPGAIERVLKLVKVKIARHRARQGGGGGDGGPPGSGEPSQRGGAQAAPRGTPKRVAIAGVGHGHGNRHGSPGGASGDDPAVAELKQINEILETKVRKLEQLVRLKDAKIQTLSARLEAAGLDASMNI